MGSHALGCVVRKPAGSLASNRLPHASTPAIALGLILGLAVADPGQAQPAAQSLSPSDCALLSAYRSALAQSEVQEASGQEILRQLRTQPPLALLEGYWVSPVDLLRLLDVAAGLDRAAFAPAVPARPGTPRDLVAFAFTAGRLKGRIPLPYVGDFQSATDRSVGESSVVLVPVKDAAEVVVEYLPPPIELPETECYYFCGDPAEWDFDGDGELNAVDPDDDADGVSDSEDAYPYWTASSTCDCGDREFVGFIEKFYSQVTAVILRAYDQVPRARREGQALRIAAAAGDQPDILFVAPGDRCEAAVPGCPDPNAPGVRYVSEDPEDCARLRFKCEKGEAGFSNECGCGCQPSGN